MADPLLLLEERLATAFAAFAGRPVDPVVRASDRADAQANGALALAKELGSPPRALAQAVIDAADLGGICREVELAGPGFINLNFDDGYLARTIAGVAADPRLGLPRADDPERVVIDYSHPNVAKEMHVGHLRTTMIGDALARMLTDAGHTVIRENHIGDWGTPFGMLIEHLVDVGEAEAARELSVGDLDGFYKQARTKFDADEAFRERARQRVVALQGGDAATLRLWTRPGGGEHPLLRRGVRAARRPPGGLRPHGRELVQRPRCPRSSAVWTRPVLLVESDGAEVVFPPGFTNRDGQPLPLIVRKGDGGFPYATTDLATVIDRVERVKATLLLYVVGAPQAQHLQMVFAVAEEVGWLQPPARAVHVPFGNVLGTDHKMLRSRSGETVKLIELLDEAVDRADRAVAEKNPDLPPDERAAVARAVGIGAVKYADLSTDRIKDYVFDWERMLAFDGNTGPYLQYAHARIRSIFRRAGVDPASVQAVTPTLATSEERALALGILGFEAAVRETLERWSPHRLCTYLFDLASTFTEFYEACPVLRSEEPLRSSRLALADLTARVLATGLALLGIEAPERM